MTNAERRDRHMLYISDDEIFEEQKRARKLTQQLNTADRSDFELLGKICKELIPNSEGQPFINPPFYCDYGTHIVLGKNFFLNYNGTILDVTRVTIGDNFQGGPNIAIYSAGHPVHPADRNTAFEYGLDVTIGDNVWIGGNAVICPGVTIGSNSVIGAGSVVTHDIPEWTLAAGNPCRPIRRITEADRGFYAHHIPIDDVCRAAMQEILAAHPGDPDFPEAPEI